MERTKRVTCFDVYRLKIYLTIGISSIEFLNNFVAVETALFLLLCFSKDKFLLNVIFHLFNHRG